MDLLELLNDIATRGGLSADDAALKTLLASPALAGVPVPDEVSKAARGLMNLDAAKNNTTLKNHYVAQALSGIDGALSEKLTGSLADVLPPAVLDQINGTQATGKKVALLIDELTKMKTPPAADKNQAEQIRVLNENLAKAKKEGDDRVAAEQTKLVDYRRTLAMQQATSSINWAAHFPEHLRGTLAQQAVQAEMEKRGAVLVFDPATDSLKLKQKASPELDFYSADGKPLSLADLTSQVAAENKFIATTATPPSGNGGGSSSNQPLVQPPPGGGSNNQPKRNSSFGNVLSNARADALAAMNTEE